MLQDPLARRRTLAWSFIAKTVLSIWTDLLKPTVRVLITAGLNLVFVPLGSAPAVTDFEQTEINFNHFQPLPRLEGCH